MILFLNLNQGYFLVLLTFLLLSINKGNEIYEFMTNLQDATFYEITTRVSCKFKMR